MKRLVNVLCISILFSGFPLSGMDDPRDVGKGKEPCPVIRVSGNSEFLNTKSLDALIALKGWKTSGDRFFLEEISQQVFDSLPTKARSKLYRFRNGDENYEDEEERGLPFYHVLILQGEPGLGKTSCGFAIGRVLGIKIVKVPATHLYDSYKKSESGYFPHLINLAKQAPYPVILIIDEFDALTNNHKNETNHDSGIIESFDDAIDDLDGSNVFLLLTTNGIEDYPAKFQDRYNRNIITISKPSREQRASAIDVYKALCSLQEIEGSWDEFFLELTESFNFREIRHLFDSAQDLANGDSIEIGDTPRPRIEINPEHFRKAAKEVISTRPSKIAAKFRRLNKRFKEYQYLISTSLGVNGQILAAIGIAAGAGTTAYWTIKVGGLRHAESLAHSAALESKRLWQDAAVAQKSFSIIGNIPYIGSVFKDWFFALSKAEIYKIAESVPADSLPPLETISRLPQAQFLDDALIAFIAGGLLASWQGGSQGAAAGAAVDASTGGSTLGIPTLVGASVGAAGAGAIYIIYYFSSKE